MKQPNPKNQNLNKTTKQNQNQYKWNYPKNNKLHTINTFKVIMYLLQDPAARVNPP